MSTLDPPTLSSRRELFLALLLSLVLGLAVVGRPAWDSELVYCASDTATCQAPWSASDGPRNPELSDSAVAFYPHYRLLSRRWRDGEVPLWNPDIYAGVPLLANAQWGALDPQVGLLVLLEVLGGARLFDLGLAWLAVLRIALAALGAYLFARRLGVGLAGAALTAAGYSLSGSVVLWLGFSLAHVTPLLPWALLGVEGLRGGERRRSAFLLLTLSLAAAIYGGHPEVAFFVGLWTAARALWLLRQDARGLRFAVLGLVCAVLLAGPLLLPFAEYLKHSGALLAHRMAESPRVTPDLLTLGVLLVFVAFLGLWRRRLPALAHDDRARSSLLAAAALGLAWFGLMLYLARRGVSWDLALGAPRSIEAGSLRLAFPVVVLVLASWSHGASRAGGEGQGGTAREAHLWSPAWLLLALGVPGVIELWRWLPLVGLAAPERAACCAALALSLVAGRALEMLRSAGRRSQRVGRWAGALAAVALLVVSSMGGDAPRPARELVALDGGDEVVRYSGLPAGAVFEGPLSEGRARLAGTVHGGLQVEELRLGFERLGEGGRVSEVADFVRHTGLRSSGEAGVSAFDFGELDLRPLGAGDWALRLEFLAGGEVLTSRRPALVRVVGTPVASGLGWAFALVVLFLICLPGSVWGNWLLVLLVVGHGISQARAWNPAVPRAEHFQPTRTEGLLAQRFEGQRVLAAPGILPPNTGLLAGLATIDGYDAMDVASFDGYRAFALKPGRNPLLDWNAEGVELESAAFRLFGVRALLFHTPRRLDGWTLVAGPEGAPESAEVYVYAADDPLPRAFCVPRTLRRREVLEDLASFDPRHSAFVEEPFSFEIEAPFEEARVTLVERAPERLVYEVALDGDGLFVSTEQHFPGWRLEVDGQARDILRVDSIFRGVFLEAGEHELRFEYAPESWRWGKLIGALGLLLLVLGTIRAR